MKKAIIILIILGCLNITVKAQFGGGLGTESSPYEIYTKAHLEELADSVNNSEPYPADNWSKGKYFKVMNDINEPVTKMIGRFHHLAADLNHSFQGHFNGQGYMINLDINGRTDWRTDKQIGLFSSIIDATIINVVVSGIVIGNGAVGGIAGLGNNSTISNSVNLAKIDGYSYVGGIVGNIRHNCVVSYCLNLGSVKGEVCVGGIVGHSGRDSYDGTNNNIISFCINAGYIKGTENCISSIVGHLGNSNDDSNTIVTNSINVNIIEAPNESSRSGIAR